jgi:hypothetical protein
LYFLTSARLFKTADGGRYPAERAVYLELEDERAIVKPHDVLLPGGSIVDVAILRVAVPSTTLVPSRVVYELPASRNAFVVSGYDPTGIPVTRAEGIRFKSTRLVVGDRDASDLPGCVGAPAVSPEGVFGVVSECEVNRCPVISLLPMARPFIERHVFLVGI